MRLQHLSLKRRLFILTIIALAPAIALLGWTEIQLRRARALEVNDLAFRYGQFASLELDRLVGGIGSLLLAISYVPEVADFDAPNCDVYLARVDTDTPHIAGLVALDGSGAVRCASLRPAPPLSAENRRHVGEAMQAGRLVTGRFQPGWFQPGSPDQGSPEMPSVLPFSWPLRDAGGTTRGALVAFLDLKWFGDRVRERGLAPGSSLTIADADGTIIAREPFPDRFVGTKIPPEFARLVHADKPGTEAVISQDGTRRLLGYFPITVPPLGLYVSAGLSEADAFQDIDATRSRSVTIMLLIGLATFGLAWIIGQRFIQRPVERLLGCIEAWRHGDFEVRTGMDPRAGELEQVGSAFDRLIDELNRRRVSSERAEAQRQLLVGELTHRVKNTLALVQAIATQSLRGAGDVASARETFQSRVRALADAHDVLTANSWESADLGDVLERTLLPYRDDRRERFSLSGAALRLQPRGALAIALAVHELATNAVKYGALATDDGRVTICWDFDGMSAEGRFRLTWTERGGLPVAAPSRTGFGSRLIEGALGPELHGSARLEYAPEGVMCRIDAPLNTVAADFAES